MELLLDGEMQVARHLAVRFAVARHRMTDATERPRVTVRRLREDRDRDHGAADEATRDPRGSRANEAIARARPPRSRLERGARATRQLGSWIARAVLAAT
jgi:hypothetical protein